MRAIAFLVMLFTGLGAAVGEEPIRAMSFNIRYGAADDGENHWKHRKEMVTDVIADFAPDLLGVQESLEFQSQYLLERLDDYSYFGRSRMNTPNEHCGIFYKSSRFVQLAGGHFWLSENPEVPASKAWDAALPRMATWLLLHDRKGSKMKDPKPVLIVNTHFDHRGRIARERSAALLSAKIEKLRTLALDPRVIVTGDFNTGEATPPYETLVSDTLKDSRRMIDREHESREGTFNSWTGKTDGARIDWILVSENQEVLSAEIVRFERDGRYPSDHFPVTTVLTPR